MTNQVSRRSRRRRSSAESLLRLVCSRLLRIMTRGGCKGTYLPWISPLSLVELPPYANTGGGPSSTMGTPREAPGPISRLAEAQQISRSPRLMRRSGAGLTLKSARPGHHWRQRAVRSSPELPEGASRAALPHAALLYNARKEDRHNGETNVL